jgi:uncharacterized damage-inducible protein DinB
MDTAITPTQFLDHWQGHRRLTRRVIEAFPEDQLFTYSIGGMRPFGALVNEMLGIGVPSLHQILGAETTPFADEKLTTRQQLLARWDDDTRSIDELFPNIPAAKFQETMTIFGQYTSQVWDLLMYAVDNEIHHRAQGYVYLRSLGIEPPPFYER